MSLLSVEQGVSSLSFFSADYELLIIEPRRPKAGVLSRVCSVIIIIVELLADTLQVAVPSIAPYKRIPRAPPVIIGPDTLDIRTDTVAATTSVNNAVPSGHNEGNRILSRSGLERLGRFQHGPIIYIVQLSSTSEPRVLNITSEHILNYVALQELERFENSQFEKELVYQDSTLLNPKKRGRPRKAALVNVGLCSDDSEADVFEDGIAVVIPSVNPRKRVHSPPSIRRRGRPKKILATNPLTVSTASQKSSDVGSSPLLPIDSYHEDEEHFVDPAFTQLVDDQEGYEDQVDNIRQDSHSAHNERKSHFKTSSALVAAAALSTESEDEENLDALHQRFLARKPSPHRPQKPSKPSTNRGDSQRKPGRPRKHTNKTPLKGASSTEDELSTIHRIFGASARNTTKSTEPEDRKREVSQQESSMKSSKPQDRFRSTVKIVKPGPGARAGYRAPSMNQKAVSTTDDSTGDSESSATPPRTEQRSSMQNTAACAPIEISDDESSDSLVAVSSQLRRASNRTPRPIDRSKQIALSGTKTEFTSMNKKTSGPADTRKRKSESQEASTSQSSENESEDEDMLALNFPIADVPSSQSYIAHPSTSSDTDRRERIIRRDEIAKKRRAAGSPCASDRRLSTTSRTQPDPALPKTQSFASAQSVSRGKGLQPVPTKVSAPAPSHPAVNLPSQLKISGPIRENSTSSSSDDSSSLDDSSMIATIKKNPSLFDRPLTQGSNRPGRKSTSVVPTSKQTPSVLQRQLSIKAPSTNLQTSQTGGQANPQPILPLMQSKPQPSALEIPSSSPVPIPSNRQPSISLSSPPQRREPSLSLGELSPPPSPARGREASMSLGETPSPPRRTLTPNAKLATAYTGTGAGLSMENTPLRQSTSTPQTALKNGKPKVERGGGQVDHSDKKKTATKKSMTPLYPGLPGMPVQKKRTMFGTREE